MHTYSDFPSHKTFNQNKSEIENVKMVRELHVAKNIDELQSFCKLSSDVKYRKIHQ